MALMEDEGFSNWPDEQSRRREGNMVSVAASCDPSDGDDSQQSERNFTRLSSRRDPGEEPTDRTPAPSAGTIASATGLDQ